MGGIFAGGTELFDVVVEPSNCIPPDFNNSLYTAVDRDEDNEGWRGDTVEFIGGNEEGMVGVIEWELFPTGVEDIVGTLAGDRKIVEYARED